MTAFSRLPEHLSTDDPSAPFTRRDWRYSTRRVLRRVRETLGDDPLFLPIVLAFTPTGKIRQLNNSTDVVIEGFPRSGNTFAYFAMKYAARQQSRHINVSSHVHTPSMVKAAANERFPTLVVVRRPMDVITSLLIAAPHVGFESALKEYIHHHHEILPLRDRFVVGAFDDVIKDFGAVTKRLNKAFGTDFACFDPTDENTDAVFAEIDENHRVVHGGTENVVPRPSNLRKSEKDWLIEQLSAPAYSGLLRDANRVYREFVPD